MKTLQDLCPCGSKQDFTDCCGPLLSGETPAPAAERLMRSRYTAFTLKDWTYLHNTTDPQTRDPRGPGAPGQEDALAEFSGLEVLMSEEKGNRAMVEFKAYYRIPGTEEVGIHHEISQFRKLGGVWYYRDGKTRN